MKKAQIKFGETFAILIIVYIILVSGLMWYNSINSNDIRELYENDRKNQAFEKYYFIINLDLLHVSQRGFIDEEFDINSIRVFEGYLKSELGREYLRERLGDAIITIKIYNNTNLSNSKEEILLYNQTPGNILGQETFRSLIPVRDESAKKNYIGLVEVKVPIISS